MKSIFGVFSAFIIFSASPSFSQPRTSLQIINQFNKEPVVGCLIRVDGFEVMNSDEKGMVSFSLALEKHLAVEANIIGFFSYSEILHLVPGELRIIELKEKTILSEEVVIQGIIPFKDQPTTFTTISSKEISKQNLGQDLPYLLQTAPSVVSTSDAGTGIGYTGISIRGSDASRVNVTVNGIPLNDAESHGVFWVNMPDFASSVDQIQIQRGVGSSTNGSAAFGASLNLQTNNLKNEAYGSINLGAGSFGTQKVNISTGTGLINKHYALDIRLSKISSDGFIDRANADLEGIFLSGGYFSEKRITKFNFIAGREITYQAWNGVPEAKLKNDPKGISEYILRNGISGNDSIDLFESNPRTFNSFTYDNQTDNYQQNHFQLFHTEKSGKTGLFNLAFHLTQGKGYYEEFRKNETLTGYGIQNFILGNDTIKNTDLIRQRWLSNIFAGSVYSYSEKLSEKTFFTSGGGFNYYEGDHFGKVVWTKLSNQNNENLEYYRNKAKKKDFNHYAKLSHSPNQSILLYADLQIRLVNYQFEGFNTDLSKTNQSVSYEFFNPKFGITYYLNPTNNLYISYGKSAREPVRDDFVNSSPTSRPRPEILHNTELGWRINGKKIKASVNHYFMYYRDQLILTGKINDVGAYSRTNVSKSYRTGLEGEMRINISKKISFQANATYSLNRVINYRYFNYNYDTGNEDLTQFSSSPIAFSPSIIGCGEIIFNPAKRFEFGIIGKHVGRQFLDNTGDLNKSVKDYTVVNIRGSYNFESEKLKNISFRFLVNNLFSKLYESHGYTFGYISGGQQINENFYFPQARINFLLGIQISF